MSQNDLNRANQKNPNHWKYWKGRRYPSRPWNWRELIPACEYDVDDSDSRNNRANQKNPNHISYWKSRGYFTRPSNWREEIDSDEYESEDEMESSYSSEVAGRVAVGRTKSTVTVQTQDTSAGNSSISTALKWIGGGLVVAAAIARVAAVAEANEAAERENRRRRNQN